jgi:hypothetical protein
MGVDETNHRGTENTEVDIEGLADVLTFGGMTSEEM